MGLRCAIHLGIQCTDSTVCTAALSGGYLTVGTWVPEPEPEPELEIDFEDDLAALLEGDISSVVDVYTGSAIEVTLITEADEVVVRAKPSDDIMEAILAAGLAPPGTFIKAS